MSFTEFYRVLLGFTGFIGFYWVLLGFTGFYWVLSRMYRWADGRRNVGAAYGGWLSLLLFFSLVSCVFVFIPSCHYSHSYRRDAGRRRRWTAPGSRLVRWPEAFVLLLLSLSFCVYWWRPWDDFDDGGDDDDDGDDDDGGGGGGGDDESRCSGRRSGRGQRRPDAAVWRPPASLTSRNRFRASPTALYRVIPRYTGFYRVFLVALTQFYCIRLEFGRVFLCFTLRFTGFYIVLPSFT